LPILRRGSSSASSTSVRCPPWPCWNWPTSRPCRGTNSRSGCST